MKGILLVDKPVGWTSFDVVAKLRSRIRATYTERGEKPTKRQLKVGHTGTLDPFATGLLIILLGDRCREANEFLKFDKTYEATIILGKTSTTGDPEGEISDYVASTDSQPTEQNVTDTLSQLTGAITQKPPAYSAIKIDGKRAYDLARQGKEVDIPERTVTVYQLDLVGYEWPMLQIRTHVSSGTYIRTLAEDIGKNLGVGGYCSELRRTRIADYDISQARSIDTIPVEELLA